MTPQIMQMMPGPTKSRKTRRPSHPSLIKTKPFTITPFMIAPVFPGESLKSGQFMAKAVTKPIKNTLIGWHAEQMFFYVKLTDLDLRDEMREMVVDPAYDSSAFSTSTDVPAHYLAATVSRTAIPWVQLCMERVVDEYFRDEDEAWDAAVIDAGQPAAKITHTSLVDSLRPTSEYEAGTVDIDTDLDADGTTTAAEVSQAMTMWQAMVQQGMTDKTYEDFIKGYGISVSPELAHKPELLRYLRDWTYPTRLVDTSDGSPTAACQWALQGRLDKKRLFKEPGFIVGFTVFKPKVYLGNLKGSLTGFMDNALSWMPAEALNNVAYGLQNFALGTGPMEAATAAYTLDLRDLMMYGEQFVNVAMTDDNYNIVAVPSLDATVTKYMSAAEVDSLFVTTGVNTVEMDSITNLSIDSHLAGDLTPAA